MSDTGGSPGFASLVARSAPLWSGEAEVFDTYFASPARTRATDLRWLERQCYKELVDGVRWRLDELQRDLSELGDPAARAHARRLAHEVAEEYDHFDAFATAHRVVAGDDLPPLDGQRLVSDGGWPENDDLAAARARHRDEHPELGVLAQAFTEGGCCTLYAAGMALGEAPGATEADAAISAACAAVYADEVDHMRADGEGVGGVELADESWAVLGAMVVEQLRLRIHMRNAQFGHPVDDARLAELLGGAAAARDDILQRLA